MFKLAFFAFSLDSRSSRASKSGDARAETVHVVRRLRETEKWRSMSSGIRTSRSCRFEYFMLFTHTIYRDRDLFNTSEAIALHDFFLRPASRRHFAPLACRRRFARRYPPQRAHPSPRPPLERARVSLLLTTFLAFRLAPWS